MAIKVDMTNTDVDRQLELLKFYPEVINKHFRSSMYRSVKGLENTIVGTIPMRTGDAISSFGSKVTGSGINLTGRVGWYDKGDPFYPNILEYGAGAHTVNAYVPELGRYVGEHPGFSAFGFMAAGYSSMKPQIDEFMRQASENVVNEMAVK